MNIEQEIYNKLVEQFSIGDICIKKRGKRKQLTWLEFISIIIGTKPSQVYTLCGFSANRSLERYLEVESVHLTVNKGKYKTWLDYFLTFLNLKKCCKCSKILPLIYFHNSSYTRDLLRHECKECSDTKSKDYNERNKELVSARVKKYTILNREKISIYSRNYYQNNKPYYRAKDAKRRAAKLQATPNWADHETIKQIYETCHEGYHVDHIVPLQNDLVCGLHCEFNLQHLTAEENQSKGNKFSID